MSYCENSSNNDGELLKHDESLKNEESSKSDKLFKSEYFEDFKIIRKPTQEEIDEHMKNEERQLRNNWYSYGIDTMYSYGIDTVSSYGTKLIGNNETLGTVSNSVLNYIPSWMCEKKEKKFSNLL